MKCHHHNVCNKNASQNVRVLIFRKESYCPGCVPDPLIFISHMIYDIDNCRHIYPFKKMQCNHEKAPL